MHVCVCVVCVHVCVCIVCVYYNNIVCLIYFFLQGKQGEIKHVYRGSVFIQSRNLVENGGLIVAKARHVELAGGTGVVSSSLYVCTHVC